MAKQFPEHLNPINNNVVYPLQKTPTTSVLVEFLLTGFDSIVKTHSS